MKLAHKKGHICLLFYITFAAICMTSSKIGKNRSLNWEKWPFWLIYSPLVFVWIYYAVKARTFWFMSNINPTLEFSGFEGEPKKEMYLQLPKADYPKTIYIDGDSSFAQVKEMLLDNGFSYPFIVKPDIGMQGLLFRKINEEAELVHYNLFVPVNYLIQDLVELPLEFSVFYIRYPGEKKGRITGFIQKEYMAVTGDGKSTLLQLIRSHPKAALRTAEMKTKHEKRLNEVLAKDEKFILSIAGNHNRGARFINLDELIDEPLCSVFDAIGRTANEFHYGRYDVKCTSIEDLKMGKNLSILEFNGSGAEPNHIYDCGMSYAEALSEIMIHWKAMYQIGCINKKRGFSYWGFVKGCRYLINAKKFFSKLRAYDINMDVEN